MLLFSLEREADWLATEIIRGNIEQPDFGSRIYADAIEVVKPGAALLLR